MVDAAALTAAVAAVSPIVGVSIGNPSDKTTWTVQLGAGATDAQRQAAQQVLAALPSAAQQALNTAVEARRDAAIRAGYTRDFGGAIGVRTLQTRDVDDTANWLTSQAAYSALVAAGQGAIVGANFRAADNTTFTLSYADGLNVLLAMAAHGAAIYANSWALKDRIAAAVDQAALAAIDVTQGWPT